MNGGLSGVLTDEERPSSLYYSMDKSRAIEDSVPLSSLLQVPAMTSFSDCYPIT